MFDRYWITPAGKCSELYRNMLNAVHLLIAGDAGSGKSVALNGIIHAALFDSPASKRFIFIDLKRVELSDYRYLPHTIAYADNIRDAITALETALDYIEIRYADMQRRRLKTYDGSDVYIFIDELADLMTVDSRHVAPLIQRICQIGRAAKFHVFAATQRPTSDVIPGKITVNMDYRLGLLTGTAQHSRNIIGIKGCENLPDPVLEHVAYGYYKARSTINLYELPMIPQSDIDDIIDHWTHNSRPKRLFFRKAV